MISLDDGTPLSQLKATALITVPSPNTSEGDVLSCVLVNPERCNHYVPYVILEGALRGHVYNSPMTMQVRRAENNGRGLPSIPLFLFNYGELSGNPKMALESIREVNVQKGSGVYRSSSEEYQLPLL